MGADETSHERLRKETQEKEKKRGEKRVSRTTCLHRSCAVFIQLGFALILLCGILMKNDKRFKFSLVKMSHVIENRMFPILLIAKEMHVQSAKLCLY